MNKLQRTIANIVKVNHAGEYGAIRIYKAQIHIAKLLYPDLLPFLHHTLDHEIEHCQKFKMAMPSRFTRPCYSMSLWSWGGYLLGFTTALMGRNGIMVCTEAVEEAVHHHMNDQLSFLKDKDTELTALIERIKTEELEHLRFAQENVKHNKITRLGYRLIFGATETLIWLSTQGALSRMKSDLSA